MTGNCMMYFNSFDPLKFLLQTCLFYVPCYPSELYSALRCLQSFECVLYLHILGNEPSGNGKFDTACCPRCCVGLTVTDYPVRWTDCY